MKSSIVALFVMSLVLTPGLAQNKKQKHPSLPAVFMNARYVHVEAVGGGDLTTPGLYPEDRQAISDVEHSLRDWNRYALAFRREQAELVFEVRKARLVGLKGSGGIHTGARMPQNGPVSGPGQNPADRGDGDYVGAGGEVGPDSDLLRVYIVNPNGKLTGPIWTRERKDGLDGPAVPLLQELKAEVERSYPRQPANKQDKHGGN